jgi:hypothetical protein
MTFPVELSDPIIKPTGGHDYLEAMKNSLGIERRELNAFPALSDRRHEDHK